MSSQPWSWPQTGQWNPSGHRAAANPDAQAAYVGKLTLKLKDRAREIRHGERLQGLSVRSMFYHTTPLAHQILIGRNHRDKPLADIGTDLVRQALANAELLKHIHLKRNTGSSRNGCAPAIGRIRDAQVWSFQISS